MRRRDRQRLADAKLVKLSQVHAVGHAFSLVRGEHDRLAGTAQIASDLAVRFRQPGTDIDDKHDDVRFSDRLAGLLSDLDPTQHACQFIHSLFSGKFLDFANGGVGI